MDIFLSHAAKDAALAGELGEALQRAGFGVLPSQDNVRSDINWARRVGLALDQAEWMVVLLTPGAVESDPSLRQNIEFALGSQRYEHRVFTVFVGPAAKAEKDVPWILLMQPHEQVASARAFKSVVKKIKACITAGVSHSNA